MSSQTRATYEAGPLPGDSQPSRQFRTSPLSSVRFARFSPETLLIPVIFALKLGMALPSTTLMELGRQTVCRLSNSLRGHPALVVAAVGVTPQVCDTPEVMRDFATVIAIFGGIGGVTGVFVLLFVGAILVHALVSVAWVWRTESYFTALWQKAYLLVHTSHADHVELPGTRLSVHARWARRLDLTPGIAV